MAFMFFCEKDMQILGIISGLDKRGIALVEKASVEAYENDAIPNRELKKKLFSRKIYFTV